MEFLYRSLREAGKRWISKQHISYYIQWLRKGNLDLEFFPLLVTPRYQGRLWNWSVSVFIAVLLWKIGGRAAYWGFCQTCTGGLRNRSIYFYWWPLKGHVKELNKLGLGNFVWGVIYTCYILLLHVTWSVVGCAWPQLSKKTSASGYLTRRRNFRSRVGWTQR